MAAEPARGPLPPPGFVPLPPLPFVHELVLERCAADPAPVAVACGATSLTYGELAAASARIAHALRAASPHGVVAVLAERSVRLVAAMLGVWRAGLVYMPLDPLYPPERLRLMLRDAGAQLLIGTRAATAALGADGVPPLVDLDALDDLGATGAAPAPRAMSTDAPLERDSLAPAYLLYTSGSTGRPKGALCTHRGLAAIMVHDYLQRRGPLRAGEPHSVWTSVGFDLFLYETLAALLVGARAEIVPDEIRFDLHAFAGWLQANRIAGAFVPGSMMRILADAMSAQPGTFALRRVLAGSEPMDEAQIRRMLAAAPGLAVHSGYGVTECSIISSFHDYHAEAPTPGLMPLGRPIDGTWLAVIDDDGAPLPPGTPGELCLGGIGVGLGYVDNPALTAARFQLGAPPELSYYRSGDLATLPVGGGPVLFHGRKDRQLKLRGVRIEPGDVEAALRGLAAVRDAVVGVRSLRGRDILVGYVLAAGEPPAARELRRHLTRLVPPAMIPEKFVPIEAVPINRNGKIDHAALAALPLE